MTVYQLKDWDVHYENDRSRARDLCNYVCVPNKQHGMGLLRILAEPNGLAVYGLWNLILGACSRQRRPRNGWLTDDGTATGKPWTVDDMALRWRLAREEVDRGMEFLSSESMNWIARHETTPAAAFAAGSSEVTAIKPVASTPVALTADSPPTHHRLPTNRREEKRSEGNGIERKVCTEAGVPPPVPDDAPDDLSVLVFPVTHRVGEPADWGLLRSKLTEFAGTFDALDVDAECRKALGWVKANPARKKSARGMPAFLFGWLNRAQDGGRGTQKPTIAPARRVVRQDV